MSIFALGLAFAISPAQAAPDARLKAAAEQAQPALIETLHDMVLIESGSGDAEGLAKMADFTEARLKALGAKTERRKATRGTGADMVIGTFEGTGSRKLMLIAHMDTVYQHGILGDPALSGRRQQDLRARHRRRQGRHRRDPAFAENPATTPAGATTPSSRCCSIRTRRSARSAPASSSPELADQHDVVLSCEPTGGGAAGHE